MFPNSPLPHIHAETYLLGGWLCIADAKLEARQTNASEEVPVDIVNTNCTFCIWWFKMFIVSINREFPHWDTSVPQITKFVELVPLFFLQWLGFHYIAKIMKKLCLQMKTHTVDPSRSNSILSFLNSFKLVCDVNCIYGEPFMSANSQLYCIPICILTQQSHRPEWQDKRPCHYGPFQWCRTTSTLTNFFTLQWSISSTRGMPMMRPSSKTIQP